VINSIHTEIKFRVIVYVIVEILLEMDICYLRINLDFIDAVIKENIVIEIAVDQ